MAIMRPCIKCRPNPRVPVLAHRRDRGNKGQRAATHTKQGRLAIGHSHVALPSNRSVPQHEQHAPCTNTTIFLNTGNILNRRYSELKACSRALERRWLQQAKSCNTPQDWQIQWSKPVCPSLTPWNSVFTEQLFTRLFKEYLVVDQ